MFRGHRENNQQEEVQCCSPWLGFALLSLPLELLKHFVLNSHQIKCRSSTRGREQSISLAPTQEPVFGIDCLKCPRAPTLALVNPGLGCLTLHF